MLACAGSSHHDGVLLWELGLGCAPSLNCDDTLLTLESPPPPPPDAPPAAAPTLAPPPPPATPPPPPAPPTAPRAAASRRPKAPLEAMCCRHRSCWFNEALCFKCFLLCFLECICIFGNFTFYIYHVYIDICHINIYFIYIHTFLYM